MKINHFKSECYIDYKKKEEIVNNNDDDINLKYEKGKTRIVTEQGAYKLPLLKAIFSEDNYMLKPEFQRRITWDNKKRSRLIESFIMNIPVPPVFIYERSYDSYEVMDGLQRISAIIDFYNGVYELTGLEEWPELNGKKYYDLPIKIKEGIDRRQLSTITLLKESSSDEEKAQTMKKMVFERLNTGGMTLQGQEIRNALYDGNFNKLCIELSKNDTFRKLWNIPEKLNEDLFVDEIEIATEDEAINLQNNNLYKRMYDVELVLRFFAMRHLDNFNVRLNDFLDNCLKSGNNYSNEDIGKLKMLFLETVSSADKLFGEKSFCQYAKNKWSLPQKMIYDPMMLALTNIKVDTIFNINLETNLNGLKEMYEKHSEEFNGKRQSKTDIGKRILIIENLLKGIIEGK